MHQGLKGLNLYDSSKICRNMLMYSCHTNFSIMEGDFSVNGNRLLCGVDSVCTMDDGYENE